MTTAPASSARRWVPKTRSWLAASVFAAASLSLLNALPVTNAALTSTTDGWANFEAAVYPAEILRTAVWHLDANDPGSMYQDETCTTPVTGVGDPVECWKDQNVAGQEVKHDWLNPPDFKIEPTMNNRGVLHFEEAHLQGPDVFGGSTDELTLFLVTREHSRTRNWLINLNGSSDNERLSVHIPWTDGKIYADMGNKSNGRSISQAPPIGTPMLLTAWKDPAIGRTGHHVHHLSPAYSSGNPPAITTGGLEIGRDAYHDVAEFIVFDKRLSEAEEEKVEDYLRWKWGVP